MPRYYCWERLRSGIQRNLAGRRGNCVALAVSFWLVYRFKRYLAAGLKTFFGRESAEEASYGRSTVQDGMRTLDEPLQASDGRSEVHDGLRTLDEPFLGQASDGSPELQDGLQALDEPLLLEGGTEHAEATRSKDFLPTTANSVPASSAHGTASSIPASNMYGASSSSASQPAPRHGHRGLTASKKDKILSGSTVMEAFDWLESQEVVRQGIKERYAKLKRNKLHEPVHFCQLWNRFYDLWTLRLILTFGQATLLIIILPLGTIVDVSCSCFFAFNGGQTFDQLHLLFPLYYMLPFMLSAFALVGSTALLLWIDVFNTPALTDFRSTLLFAFFPSFAEAGSDDEERPSHGTKVPAVRRLQILTVLILDVLPFVCVFVQVYMLADTMTLSIFWYLVFEAHIFSAGVAAMLYFVADVRIAIQSCDWNPGAYSAQRMRNVLDFLMKSYHIKLTRVHPLAWKKVRGLHKLMLYTNKEDAHEFRGNANGGAPFFRHPDRQHGTLFWLSKRMWEHGGGFGYLVGVELVAWTLSCLYLRIDSNNSAARGVSLSAVGVAIFLLVCLAFSLGKFLTSALPELRGTGQQYNAVLCAYLVVAGVLAITAGTLPLAGAYMSSSTAPLDHISYVGPGFHNTMVDLNPRTEAESAVPFKTHYPVCMMRWGSDDAQLTSLDLAGLAKAVYLKDDDLSIYRRHLEHLFPSSRYDWTLEYVSDGWPRYSYVYFAPKDPAGRGTRVVSIKGTSTPEDVILDVYFMANIVTVGALNKALLPIFFFVRPYIMERLVNFKMWSMKLNNTRKEVWLDPTVQFINQTQREHPQDDLLVTGHSLGGFMAQVVGASLDVPVLAWSGMGTTYNSGMIHPYLGDFHHLFPSDYEPGMRSILNVIPEHDPVPKCGVQVGSVQNIRCLGFAGNPFACHMLDRTMCELVRVCDDEVGRNFTDYCAGFLDPAKAQ